MHLEVRDSSVGVPGQGGEGGQEVWTADQLGMVHTQQEEHTTTHHLHLKAILHITIGQRSRVTITQNVTYIGHSVEHDGGHQGKRWEGGGEREREHACTISQHWESCKKWMT